MAKINQFNVYAYLDITKPSVGSKYPAYAFFIGPDYDNVQVKNDQGNFILLTLSQENNRYQAFLGYFLVATKFVFKSSTDEVLEVNSFSLNLDGESILFTHQVSQNLRTFELAYLTYSKTCVETTTFKIYGFYRYFDPLAIEVNNNLRVEYNVVNGLYPGYFSTILPRNSQEFYVTLPVKFLAPVGTETVIKLKFSDVSRPDFIVEKEYNLTVKGCEFVLKDSALLTKLTSPNLISKGVSKVYQNSLLSAKTEAVNAGAIMGFWLNDQLIATKEINNLGVAQVVRSDYNQLVGKLSVQYRKLKGLVSELSPVLTMLGPTSNLLVTSSRVYIDNFYQLGANFEIKNMGPDRIVSGSTLTLTIDGLGLKQDLEINLYGYLPNSIDLNKNILLGQDLLVNSSILISIYKLNAEIEKPISCIRLTVTQASNVNDSCLTNKTDCVSYEPVRSYQISSLTSIIENQNVIKGNTCSPGEILEIYVNNEQKAKGLVTTVDKFGDFIIKLPFRLILGDSVELVQRCSNLAKSLKSTKFLVQKASFISTLCLENVTLTGLDGLTYEAQAYNFTKRLVLGSKIFTGNVVDEIINYNSDGITDNDLVYGDLLGIRLVGKSFRTIESGKFVYRPLSGLKIKSGCVANLTFVDFTVTGGSYPILLVVKKSGQVVASKTVDKFGNSSRISGLGTGLVELEVIDFNDCKILTSSTLSCSTVVDANALVCLNVTSYTSNCSWTDCQGISHYNEYVGLGNLRCVKSNLPYSGFSAINAQSC